MVSGYTNANKRFSDKGSKKHQEPESRLKIEALKRMLI